MLKIITKCGYNRNTALPIRAGPKELCQAGLYSFKNTMGAPGVKHFKKNKITQKKDIGKTLFIAMSWTQHSSRSGVPNTLKRITGFIVY